MKRVTGLLLAIFLGLSLATSTALADPAKGQKLYLKYMKKTTGMNGAKFAAVHTQDEWEELFEEDGAGFKKEFGTSDRAKKFFGGKKFEKIMPHIKDFVIEYASDSGNVPSC